MTQVFIGIDTGTEKCGVAVIDQDGKVIRAEVLIMRHKDVLVRLERLYWQMYDFLCEYEHAYAAGIEEPFIGRNKKTALTQAYAWGVVYSALVGASWGVAAYRISPLEAKVALTGNSKASKEDMVAAVKLQLGIDVPEDAADAIGNALAARQKYLEEHIG